MKPFTLHRGDALEVLERLSDNSIEAVVTDPPYELGFMGKSWDSTGISYRVELWAQVLRVLKPGGHMLAFGGTRTYHRMTCAIEDAGFQIRDQIQWIFGSGFPKSLDVSKAIDKAAGAERKPSGTWKPRGSAKPAMKGKKGHFAAHPNAAIKKYEREEVILNRYDVPATPAAKQWHGWGTALKPASGSAWTASSPSLFAMRNSPMVI